MEIFSEVKVLCIAPECPGVQTLVKTALHRPCIYLGMYNVVSEHSSFKCTNNSILRKNLLKIYLN